MVGMIICDRVIIDERGLIHISSSLSLLLLLLLWDSLVLGSIGSAMAHVCLSRLYNLSLLGKVKGAFLPQKTKLDLNVVRHTKMADDDNTGLCFESLQNKAGGYKHLKDACRHAVKCTGCKHFFCADDEVVSCAKCLDDHLCLTCWIGSMSPCSFKTADGSTQWYVSVDWYRVCKECDSSKWNTARLWGVFGKKEHAKYVKKSGTRIRCWNCDRKSRRLRFCDVICVSCVRRFSIAPMAKYDQHVAKHQQQEDL